MNVIQAMASLDRLQDKINALNAAIGRLESDKDLKPHAFHLQQIRSEIETERNELRNKLQNLEVE